MADQTQSWLADQQQLDALKQDYRTLFLNDLPAPLDWGVEESIPQHIPSERSKNRDSVDDLQGLRGIGSPIGITHTEQTSTEEDELDDMYRKWLNEQAEIVSKFHLPIELWRDLIADRDMENGLPNFSGVVVPLAPSAIDCSPIITSTNTLQKNGSRIQEPAKQSLEMFFSQNPYPTAEEREQLALSTGLSTKRVKNWFSNARARRTAPGDEDAHQSADNRVVRARLSQESLEKLDEDSRSLEKPSVMEAYLSASIEDTQIATAIYQAAQTQKMEDRKNDIRASSRNASRARSIVSSRASSGGSTQSRHSAASQKSNGSSVSRTRRRGRKRFMAVDTTQNVPGFKFPCTFCWKLFRNRYEWSRHEETVHVGRHRWVCCDHKEADPAICPFCDVPSTTSTSIADSGCHFHRYLDCRKKPETDRTFFRKDQFLQHLNSFHRVRLLELARSAEMDPRETDLEKKLVKTWYKGGLLLDSANSVLHCGFCGKLFAEWKERSDHVAGHFKTGALSRSAWWPERLDTTLEGSYLAMHGYGYQCIRCWKQVTRHSDHPNCSTWSCRYAKDENALFIEDGVCILCEARPNLTQREEHAIMHGYRTCAQARFLTPDFFLQHLLECHSGRRGTTFLMTWLDSFKSEAILSRDFLAVKSATWSTSTILGQKFVRIDRT